MRLDEQAKLEERLVGDISGHFCVPSYQRGYRWGKEEVTLLLQDIWDNGEQNYCLQPVVVKAPTGDRGYELIDGQQRLTTLYLLLLYMKNENMPNIDLPFSLEYETRPRSAAYLTTLEDADKDSNIDFFHMHGAYRYIKAWFDEKGNRRQYVANKFYSLLFERVKVIWYEADPAVDAITLFTRLNVGRIPLTNAELVKALLLGRKSGIELDHQHRQIEIASQWDMIERELHDREFWGFLTNRKGRDFPTRIEYLFNLLAGSEKSKERYYTFFQVRDELKNHPPAEVWRRVLELYYLLREWFEDRDLYHKIGYLIADGESLLGLLKKSQGITKKEFLSLLDGTIRQSLNLSADDVADLSYEKSEQCNRLLLFMNVESVRTLHNSSERFPFHAHKAQSWSLEHIHAQHAESLTKKGQWQEWLSQHRAVLETLKLDDGAKASQRDALLGQIKDTFAGIDKDSFVKLSGPIMEFISAEDSSDWIHSLANLALLPIWANSALNNSVFEVKRRMIIGFDRKGDYIPICTRRVFLKYYTEAGDQQNHLWGPHDRKGYLDAMLSPDTGVLRPYLQNTKRTKI